MISIDPRFNGPTDCGHGGVSAGRFAELVNPLAASVRFAAPIALTVIAEGGLFNSAAFLMGRAVNALVHTDAAADRAARRGRCHPPGPCRWLRAGGTAAAG